MIGLSLKAVFMKIIIFIYAMAASLNCFGAYTKAQAVISIGEVEATVRVEGRPAQMLFESLETPVKKVGLTSIKETSEIACFQYNQTLAATYSCSIFVFMNKDFISTKSRYL
jgi:hypothetical protein